MDAATNTDKAMLLMLLLASCLAVANLYSRGEWAGEVIVYGEKADRVYHVRDFGDWDAMLESIAADDTDTDNLADTEE
jgi:hypothetical protein